MLHKDLAHLLRLKAFEIKNNDIIKLIDKLNDYDFDLADIYLFIIMHYLDNCIERITKLLEDKEREKEREENNNDKH